MTHNVFVSGATGFIGRALTAELVGRGHMVRALVRPGSEHRVINGCEILTGNPLDGSSFASCIEPADTFIHLIGTAHPAPWKEKEFRAVDLVSAKASIEAAQRAGVSHFVYLSVAHPAPLMRAYIRVRQECEAALRGSGLNATIIRPWYVTGPGRQWPVILLPAYALLERISVTRNGAVRLGLVTLEQVVAALANAVEDPPDGFRIVETAGIRKAGGT